MWKLLVLLAAFLLIFTDPAFTSDICACGGGAAASLDEMIDDVPVIVKAQVIEVDDIAQNGIIRVEAYLKGGPGPEYILLEQNHPAVIAGLLEQMLGYGDCYRLREHLTLGETLYLFLERSDSGSYTLASSVFNADHYTFPDPEATVTIAPGLDTGPTVILTEVEFRQYIAERLGQIPTAPDRITPYPFAAPLLITTTTTRYIYPLDGRDPVELTGEIYLDIQMGSDFVDLYYPSFLRDLDCDLLECVVFSPHHSVAAAVLPDENTIIIAPDLAAPITGQALLFSNTDDSAAIWNGNQLAIHSLRARPYWGPLQPVITLDYRPGDEWLAGRGVWTRDGRILAYSDARGLWLWDVLGGQEPIQLIPADDDIPVALYFSPGGHYLAFQEGDRNFILDLWLDTILPGDVPDDFQYQPYTELMAVYDFLDPNVQWVSLEYPMRSDLPTTYLRAVCSDRGCHVYENSRAFYGDTPLVGAAFTYEPVGGTLAVLAGPDSITFADQDYGEPRTLQFTLDGDIVHIEWLYPEFYVSDSALPTWIY
jgi:hypothetical protein